MSCLQRVRDDLTVAVLHQKRARLRLMYADGTGDERTDWKQYADCMAIALMQCV